LLDRMRGGRDDPPQRVSQSTATIKLEYKT
jgi:hypothetical protein